MSCGYCGKMVTEEEMRNETLVSIREFKYDRKKSEIKFMDGGVSLLVHKRCFAPPYPEAHPCMRGWVE
jgi:hypothetical protein